MNAIGAVAGFVVCLVVASILAAVTGAAWWAVLVALLFFVGVVYGTRKLAE